MSIKLHDFYATLTACNSDLLPEEPEDLVGKQRKNADFLLRSFIKSFFRRASLTLDFQH